MSQEKDLFAEWPKGLVSAFNRKKVVVFTGSGLSCRARSVGGLQSPTWPGLLRNLLDDATSRGIISKAAPIEEIGRLISNNSVDDHLVAAEYIKRQYEKNHVNIKPVIDGILRKFQPDEAHDIISRLPVAGYISTNYDTYLQDVYGRINPRTLVTYSAHSKDALSAVFGKSGGPWIIKLHGQIGFSEDLVLSFDEYENAYSTGHIETLLTALLSRFTVLFVGFGFRDPPIMGVLRSIFRRLRTESKPHYAFADSHTLDVEKSKFLQRTYGIRTIRYPKLVEPYPDYVKDPHHNFLKWLIKLESDLRTARPPSVRLLIDFRAGGKTEATHLYPVDNPETGSKVFLWPSIEWPHLPADHELSNDAKHSLLNAIRDQFSLDSGKSAALEIKNIGHPFIDANKPNISADGLTYDFYFQFITIYIKDSHIRSLLKSLPKEFDGIRPFHISDIDSDPHTSAYNAVPIAKFRQM